MEMDRMWILQQELTLWVDAVGLEFKWNCVVVRLFNLRPSPLASAVCKDKAGYAWRESQFSDLLWDAWGHRRALRQWPMTSS